MRVDGGEEEAGVCRAPGEAHAGRETVVGLWVLQPPIQHRRPAVPLEAMRKVRLSGHLDPDLMPTHARPQQGFLVRAVGLRDFQTIVQNLSTCPPRSRT